VVKAQLEWQGSAHFEDDLAIRVVPTRLGTSSFDLTYTATVESRPTCVGTVTYVSVVPGTADPVTIPDVIRAALEGAQWAGGDPPAG